MNAEENEVRSDGEQFEPGGEDETKEAVALASQWQLAWWRFQKHKLANFAIIVLGVLYLTMAFCEFLSPFGTQTRFSYYSAAPPMKIRLFENGKLVRPYVYRLVGSVNPSTLRRTFLPDTSTRYSIRFFAKGEKYRLWGLIRTDLHLMEADEVPLFLFGTDTLGRDLFSRILYGSRISLTVGLVGIVLTFVLGLLLGGLAGYLGGIVDEVIMRIVDLIVSIPTLPLWMGLAAALPRDWPPLRIYFGIVIIFSVINWTGLARTVRSKLLSLREEDFVVAAYLSGSSDFRIILKHLLPSFASYIIVSLTLSIPGMILGETALSFIGLGLQPPVVSWGTLLQDAQDIQAIAHYPWLLSPCVFVILAVLMYNFLGDGLRDSVDPLH